MPGVPVMGARPILPAKSGLQGLSPETQKLWLAAIRYRKLADTLAVSESRTPAP